MPWLFTAVPEKTKETTETSKATEPVVQQHSVEAPDELHKDQTTPVISTTGCRTIFHDYL